MFNTLLEISIYIPHTLRNINYKFHTILEIYFTCTLHTHLKIYITYTPHTRRNIYYLYSIHSQKNILHILYFTNSQKYILLMLCAAFSYRQPPGLYPLVATGNVDSQLVSSCILSLESATLHNLRSNCKRRTQHLAINQLITIK